MYYQYFGLSEAPFSIAVNPRYLYMSPRHRDALAHLLYGVGAGGGFILLTGEVGTGKTTINRCLIEQLPDNADIAIVLNPALGAADLLATVCEELDIQLPEPQPGLKRLTDALHAFLLANHAAGRKTVLMIDEAQHLDFEVLEQIRLLTNLETNEEKLLHIILIGQPELADKLARPELRQLNQRITARFELGPLSAAETGAYIRHRLHIAGMPAGRELFPAAVVRAIHRRSRGVPRLINLLCDRMLLGAYGQGVDRLNLGLLRRAEREVTGDAGQNRAVPHWLLPVLALCAVLVVVAALWALLGQRRPGEELPLPVTDSAPLTPPDAARGVSADTTPPLVADAAPASAVPTTPGWRLTPAAGAALFLSLYDEAAANGRDDPCGLLRDEALRCERVMARSWNQLQADNRPALLPLVDERRYESRVLFLGLEGEQVLLGTRSGPVPVALETLATQWDGSAWQVWRRPEGIARTLQRGDRGADVGTVASLFARIDGQSRPLTVSEFDERLEARVRLFQQQYGLAADGMLGERTLRALSLAAGVDLDLAAARARLRQADAGALR
jgi:general secretion pathway protein A